MTLHTEQAPIADEPPFDPEYDTRTTPTNDIDQHLDSWSPHRPPHDPAAERALLGALLNEPRQASHAATLLDPSDFYFPKHETLWNALHAVTATGALAEPVLVLEHLARTSALKAGALDALYLHECSQAGEFGQIDDYARIVLDTAKLRTALEGATKITQAVRTARRDTVATVMDTVVDALDHTAVRFGASTNTTARRHVETIDELLAGEEDDSYDWVIPGLLEHQERVILTAEEGAGKSTLLRQIAIQAASGIHPFTLDPITPITVLHIDVENTRRQSRRRYRPMRIQAGHQLESERLRIELRTAGLDLTTDEDRDWLLSTCLHVQPDLLLIGPIYKLANGDPTEEKSAKPVAMALDAVRDQIDCAVILEAHAAKSPSGQKKRPHEPYGWSGWLRWPEIGLWLDKDGTLSPWRGAREERSWPTTVQRGGTWPWSAVLSDTERNWETIRRARLDNGEHLSYRELMKATGLTKASIERVIGPGMPYRTTWQSINGRPTQRTIEEEM